MKKKILLLLSLIPLHIFAQDVPTIIMHATIHTGNGSVIENGVMVFEKGKIISVSQHLDAKYKNGKSIDAKGLHVYPGLINMCSYAGLNEIDMARPTHDFNEVGEFNPNVRSLIAYNTDSKILSTLKTNGILLQQVAPRGGIVSGTSSCMRSFGWNWEDAVYLKDEGMHVHWPEFNPLHSDDKERKQYDDKLNEWNQFVLEAQAYAQELNHESINLKLESFIPVLNGAKNMYVHVNSAHGIHSFLQWIKKYPNIHFVLCGVRESAYVLDEIKEAKCPVICLNLHRLPQQSSDDVKQAFRQAGSLTNAGILTAIGIEGSWESRNLSYIAGTAAAYGLSKEDALRAISLNPAKIMGIDHLTGSIESGKEANFIICKGDLLDMKSSEVLQAFFQGIEIPIRNFQNDLNDKFKSHLKK